jgi:competence protein ComEA
VRRQGRESAQEKRKRLALRLVVAAAALAVLAFMLASSGIFGGSAAFGGRGKDSADSLVAPAPAASEPEEAKPPAPLVVFVSGAVERPGLYELAAGMRAGDAVALAGGISADGAPDFVNLASVVEDGQHIKIPTREEAAAQAQMQAQTTASGTAAGQKAGTAANGKVNINTADLATLQTLNGIGPATAQKIIDYRVANGPFASPDSLKAVAGIGEKKYAAIAGLICV